MHQVSSTEMTSAGGPQQNSVDTFLLAGVAPQLKSSSLELLSDACKVIIVMICYYKRMLCMCQDQVLVRCVQ